MQKYKEFIGKNQPQDLDIDEILYIIHSKSRYYEKIGKKNLWSSYDFTK